MTKKRKLVRFPSKLNILRTRREIKGDGCISGFCSGARRSSNAREPQQNWRLPICSGRCNSIDVFDVLKWNFQKYRHFSVGWEKQKNSFGGFQLLLFLVYSFLLSASERNEKCVLVNGLINAVKRKLPRAVFDWKMRSKPSCIWKIVIFYANGTSMSTQMCQLYKLFYKFSSIIKLYTLY